MGLYDRLVGSPWVYDRVRPLLTGGLDLSPAYAFDRDLKNDVIVDVGCGTGDALRYLTAFRAFHGFDPDERAVSRLLENYVRPEVQASARMLAEEDVLAIRPTLVLMVGALHHMDDDTAGRTLRLLGAGGSVTQIRTLDVQRVSSDPMNNLFVKLDRGGFVRTRQELAALVDGSGFRVARWFTFRPRIPLPSYLVMDLVPAPPHSPQGRGGAGEQG